MKLKASVERSREGGILGGAIISEGFLIVRLLRDNAKTGKDIYAFSLRHCIVRTIFWVYPPRRHHVYPSKF